MIPRSYKEQASYYDRDPGLGSLSYSHHDVEGRRAKSHIIPICRLSTVLVEAFRSGGISHFKSWTYCLWAQKQPLLFIFQYLDVQSHQQFSRQDLVVSKYLAYAMEVGPSLQHNASDESFFAESQPISR